MNLVNRLLWYLFYFVLFICSTALSWSLHKPLDFGFSLWYQVIDIESHVNEYAPKNRQGKKDFSLTTTEDHQALFNQINQGIHNNGKGLDNISYSTTVNANENKLLTDAEIVHLTDVANLLNFLFYLTLVCFALLVVVIFIIKRYQLPPPDLKTNIATLALLTISISLLFVLIGFETIFYQLHIWIFPQNHQWFFYYQDSLMSTLMKAPELFIYIALSIIAITSLIYFGLLSLFKKLI